MWMAEIVLLFHLLIFSSINVGAQTNNGKRPNIVILMTDDQDLLLGKNLLHRNNDSFSVKFFVIFATHY